MPEDGNKGRDRHMSRLLCSQLYQVLIFTKYYQAYLPIVNRHSGWRVDNYHEEVHTSTSVLDIV